MSDKKKFLLRLDESLYAALEKWAASDLRSVNAQIEFLLSDAMRKAGRLKAQDQFNDSRENSDRAPSV
ncbi:MAG: Arc family DNA-binding protein [Ignavibacteriales bacterium]|nr:Arc family DNA-binding protein [Ignavibacteriales bacterium]